MPTPLSVANSAVDFENVLLPAGIEALRSTVLWMCGAEFAVPILAMDL